MAGLSRFDTAGTFRPASVELHQLRGGIRSVKPPVPALGYCTREGRAGRATTSNIGMANLYDDLVMDHIKNARNYSVMIPAQSRLSGSNPLCGDEITLFINLRKEHIDRITFQAECCGIAMASTSIMSEMLTGKRKAYVTRLLDQFLLLLNERLAPVEEAPDLRLQALLDTVSRFPSRTGCAALPWVTLDFALRENRVLWPNPA